KIPEGGERTSHAGRDYDIAQWYPQIAAYDKYGWDKSQYLGPAEFHNEYGAFDVNITLPKSFTMGFSGELTNPEEVYPESVRTKLEAAKWKTETTRIADYSTAEWKNGEDTTLVTWKFHAENVRDFAWSANENYIWDVSHFAPNDGEQPVTIHALYFPDKAEFWTNAAEYGRHAISYFSEHFGRYAYKNCFVVEGPVGGGMEYPGITFIGHYGDKNSHSPFGVIVHEVGHNWFPMMVGSNETNFAFMDEGFTSFLTALATEAYWGRYNNSYVWTEWYQKMLAFSNDDVRADIQRSSHWLAKTGYEEPIATHIYRFKEGHYGTSIYPKTAGVMYMLQYVLGDSAFEVAMKEYFRRWKFKHPYPEDFYAAMQEASGNRDLRWFFNEWFERTFMCDYGICGLKSETVKNNDTPVYKTSFHVYRTEKAIMPLDVEIEMEDGSKQTVWIPVDKWVNAEIDFDTTIELPAKPVRAEINPDGRIMDVNRLNNRTGFPKTTIEFDNTIHSINPIDSYLLRWRPSFWYTDEGGWNIGYKLTGSYLEDMKRFTFYNLYNIREQSLDYDLSVSHNFYKYSPMLTFDGRAYTLEGRKGYSLYFNKGLRRNYSTPPFHNVNVQYSFSQLMNREYLLNPFSWDEGRLHRMLFGYSYYNRGESWNLNAYATLEGSASLFGQSDFQYSKRTFELKTTFSLDNGSTVGFRLYSGVGFGNIPTQSKYYLSGASPLEQFNAPFFRSKGMLPTEIRDHAFSPGGGNVRGYYNSLFGADKMDAFNIEWKWTSYLPPSVPRIPFADYLLKYLRGSIF
ncbi:MAG: M1 family peptidase, partial [Bacteroidetes bacterium]